MRRVGPLVLLTVLFACKSKQPDNSSQTPASTAPSTPSTASAPAASTGTEAQVASSESAVAPEVNPPGDIPDTQAFVNYTSAAGGYSFDVPEGWARTETGSAVTFISKLDGVKMDVVPASAAPTATSARTGPTAQIQSQGRAVSITSVSDVRLPSGTATVIKYLSNSEPNSVTHKQVRLENEAYLLFKNGKLATLTLWAPQGADNVDQWNRMSKSFRWR